MYVYSVKVYYSFLGFAFSRVLRVCELDVYWLPPLQVDGDLY